jgi:peptidase M28-like protein
VHNAQLKGRVTALALVLAVGAATAGHAQTALNKYGNPLQHPPKPTSAAITAEELRTRLYIFSDDTMQGRQVATVGNMKGTAYIASELRRLGVEPGGDNGGYFQRLPYVHRMFTDQSTISAGTSTLALNSDFAIAPGAHAPKEWSGVVAIYGGVDGDTLHQITAAQAAGKFVILSPGAAAPGGGRGFGGGFGGGNVAPLPAGCPEPVTGGRGGGGRGGANAVSQPSAESLERFADAAAIALVDLDALSAGQRANVSDPLAATSVGGGRGGAADPATMAVAAVATPNPAFKATAGDMVVTNGNQIAVVRGGMLVSGVLPAGWTPETVKQKADSMSRKSADSTALVMERRDTVVAAARRLLAANSHAGSAMFEGHAIALDSSQIVALACAPTAAGRGGINGRGGAANGRGGRQGGAGAAEAPTTVHLTSAAAAKLLGGNVDATQVGATGGTVASHLDYVETPSDWARNVVGIVRGSDPKLAGEYVAIGAHNDHNGIRPGGHIDHDSLKAWNDENLRLQLQVVKGDLRAITPAQRAAIHVNMDSIRRLHPVARIDSVQNGADDDGSGSMGVLEIAEAVAKMPVKPKRSIIFIWHTGEEAGLLGSSYWTANPTVPIDSVVAQINIDMIGRGRAEDMVGGGPNYLGAVGSKRLSRDLNKQMLAVNAAEPATRKLRIDYRFDDATLGTSVDGKPVSWPGYNNIYGRSDHANYANKCVPIVFFFTGLHGDYHQNTDEPQYIDYPHYSLITNYIRDLLVAVANKPTRPALNNVCTRR